MSIFIMTLGKWKPGIGDPSLMGWFTVFSYYLVAAICLLKVTSMKLPPGGKYRQFWGFICFALIIMGLIKQFNLLSAVTETGRIIVVSCGWMEHHRIIQAWTMVLICFTGLIVTGILYRRLSQSFSIREKMAVIGLAYLTLFVVLRAVSLHQFGTVLSYEIRGARVNWIAELFGIYCICLSVFLPQHHINGHQGPHLSHRG